MRATDPCRLEGTVTHAAARPTGPDDALRARVMRKVAWRLSPFLGLLYFINYLDRTNISFAAPHGMNDALGFDKAAYGLASGLFFIGYLILEVPSNLAPHRLHAGGAVDRGWAQSIVGNALLLQGHRNPQMAHISTDASERKRPG